MMMVKENVKAWRMRREREKMHNTVDMTFGSQVWRWIDSNSSGGIE